MTPGEMVELRFYLKRVKKQREAEYSLCKSKMAWGSRNLAARAIHRKHSKDGIHPYRCFICGLWHVGAWHARRG